MSLFLNACLKYTMKHDSDSIKFQVYFGTYRHRNWSKGIMGHISKFWGILNSAILSFGWYRQRMCGNVAGKNW